jgi:hypothetical protein
MQAPCVFDWRNRKRPNVACWLSLWRSINMKKIASQTIDVLKLSDEVERESQSGALSRSLLHQSHTLYEPDTEDPKDLRRHLPSGQIERGYLSNGEFFVTKVIRLAKAD